MFHVQTLDGITEGSTLINHQAQPGRGCCDTKYMPQISGTDTIGARPYNDASMDGDFSGHKDTKNHRLTVKNKSVHNMRHANEKNHNSGDFRKHIKDINRSPNSRVLNYSDSQPVGCNGPVICKLGKQMQNVITAHDPDAPVHAATHTQFAHGGVLKGNEEAPSSMLAPGVVPTSGPDGMSLNNAAGMHYAINIGPGDAITGSQKKDFMSSMV